MLKKDLLNKHVCNKELEIEVLRQKIDEIHRAIVGDVHDDDSPGIRSNIRMISVNIQNHNERLRILESLTNGLINKMAYYAGGVAVIVFLITWVGPKIIGG